MSEWKNFCLGDVCKFIDYRGKTPPKVKSGVPLVTAKIIKDGFIQEPKEFIAEEFYSEWMRRGIPKKGDVVFTTEAPLGEVAQIKTNRKLAFAQRVIIFESDNDVLCSSYLFYALRDTKLKSRIEARQSGTTVSGIKASELKKVEIDLPPLETQKKIAAVLSAFDDKIELNNAINKNLEEQAQAIFDEFYRKADEEVFLGKTCKCELGGTPSRKNLEYWNGNISWINSGEVNKFRIIAPSEKITELGLKKSATKLLPAKTTVIAITGATLGQVSLLEIESCANQSVVGVIPNEKVPYEYIYPLIKMKISELLTHQTGGAQQHINKQNVENLSIRILSPNLMRKYLNIVSVTYELIANNCFETKKLGELRDALLPRLMSGEIDVSAVEI